IDPDGWLHLTLARHLFRLGTGLIERQHSFQSAWKPGPWGAIAKKPGGARLCCGRPTNQHFEQSAAEQPSHASQLRFMMATWFGKRTAVHWKFGHRASCRMESPHLTRLWPVALPFTWSRWLTIIGGWVWKLVESTSI